MLFKSNY